MALVIQNKKVVFLGLPGAGKTHVVKGGISGTKFREVNFGDEMERIAKKMQLIGHRDEMRKLDKKVYEKIQAEAGLAIAALDGDILVNTHCTINTPYEFVRGLPDFLLDALKPDLFIAVWASAEDIAKWRNSDQTRQRDNQAPEELARHAAANDEALVHYAKYTGKPVFYIQNKDGALAQTQDRLRALLQ